MTRALSFFACFALAACATTPASQSREYVAQFNEPFLTFVSDGALLTRTSPENMDGVAIAATRSMENGATRFDWPSDGGTVSLVITPGQCFDDMAGFEFSHQAQLLDSKSDPGFMGCARLTSEPQPRE